MVTIKATIGTFVLYQMSQADVTALAQSSPPIAATVGEIHPLLICAINGTVVKGRLFISPPAGGPQRILGYQIGMWLENVQLGLTPGTYQLITGA